MSANIRLTVDQICEAVSGSVVIGSGTSSVSLIREPAEADANSVAFIISPAFVKDVANTKAQVLVVQQNLIEQVKAVLPSVVTTVVASPNAYLGLARLSQVYAQQDAYADWRPDAFAESGNIHPTAKIHSSARVLPGAVICADVEIGEGTAVFPGAVVGPGCRIGRDCTLFSGVVLYPRTQLGDRVRLHAHVVLGCDGFGYAPGPKGSEKIWHLGRVIVGNDVEIGAQTCIDRGTIRDSIVEDGVKVDNLVQVGHNGHLKAHSILCAQVGLAGNVTVGRAAILAGQAGIADKQEIGDKAIVGPQAGVSKDVPAGTVVMSAFTAKPRREWWKLLAYFERLPEVFERLKKLEGNNRGGT